MLPCFHISVTSLWVTSPTMQKSILFLQSIPSTMTHAYRYTSTTRKITFPPKQYKVYRTLHPHPSLLNPSPRSLQAPTPPIAQRETTKRITCLTPDWGRGEEGEGGNSPKPANESQKVNIIKSKTQKTDCPAITQP